MMKKITFLVVAVFTLNGLFAQVQRAIGTGGLPAIEENTALRSGLDYIDFEDEEDFAQDFSPWENIDIDGQDTYGFETVEFPGDFEPMAFIAFNPAATSPSLADDEALQPHTGERFGACFASVPDPDGNDDWLITPFVTLVADNPTFDFWAKSYTDQYGLERFKVGVSTTDTDPGSFTIISEGAYEEAPLDWTEYSYDLSAYAGQNVYVGIQCVSFDAFIFMVDDVTISAEAGTVLFSDDFEGYNTGDYLALNSDTWTTWSDTPGTDEDAFIVDDQSNSPSQSVNLEGISDLLLPLGDLVSGIYQVDFWMYIPSGNGGYFNLQHFEAPGIEWALEVYYGVIGDARVNAGGPDAAFFNFNHDEWFFMSTYINLNEDVAELYYNNEFILSWQWSLQATGAEGTKQLGGLNLYAGAETGETPFYYIDDVAFIEIEAGGLGPVVDLDQIPIQVVLPSGQSQDELISFGNAGDDVLEYETVVVYEYDQKQLALEPKPLKNNGKNINVVADPTPNPSATNPEQRDVVLNYDGDNANAVGLNNPNEWRVAAKFPADLVAPYVGMELTSVDVYINDQAAAYELEIYGMGSFNTPGPGDLLRSQVFSDNGPAAWVTIVLDEPLIIDGQDIWVGYWLDQTETEVFIAGCDAGPAVPNGDWIRTGPGWGHLSSEIDANWNIRALLTGEGHQQWLTVSPQSGTLEPQEFIDLTASFDASNVSAAAYQADIRVRSNDLANEDLTVSTVLIITVGLDENGKREVVSFFPNPASDFLRFNANTIVKNIMLFNAAGQLVYQDAPNSVNGEVNISDFETGIYMLQIETEYGQSTQKILID